MTARAQGRKSGTCTAQRSMQRRMIPIAASGYALVRQSALVYAAIAQDEICQALQDSRHASILCVDKQPTTRVADSHNPQLELAFGDKNHNLQNPCSGRRASCAQGVGKSNCCMRRCHRRNPKSYFKGALAAILYKSTDELTWSVTPPECDVRTNERADCCLVCKPVSKQHGYESTCENGICP